MFRRGHVRPLDARHSSALRSPLALSNSAVAIIPRFTRSQRGGTDAIVYASSIVYLNINGERGESRPPAANIQGNGLSSLQFANVLFQLII